MKGVTFVFKTFLRPWCGERLIKSIVKTYPEAKIIAVDDSSEPRRLLAYAPWVSEYAKVIETEFDIGLSAGRNLGVQAATTDLVYICDDDHTITSGVHLEHLVDTIDAEGLDILGSRQRTARNPLNLERRAKTMHLTIAVGEGDVVRCDMVPNIFLARREVLLANPWDEELKVYEHWPYFWVAKKNGVKVAMCMSSWATHRGGWAGDDYKKHRGRGSFRDLAMKKHGFNHTKWPHQGGYIKRRR